MKGRVDELRDDKHRDDDRTDELCLSFGPALPRMVPAAFSVARNGSRRPGRRRNGVVPPHHCALYHWRRRAGAHVAGASRYVLLLCARTFRWGRRREVVAACRGSLANSEGQRRGEWLDTSFHPPLLRCPAQDDRSLAGGGLASRR